MSASSRSTYRRGKTVQTTGATSIDIGKQITCPYIRTAHGFLLLLSQQHRNQIRAPMSV
jgi:hypothetical protein